MLCYEALQTSYLGNTKLAWATCSLSMSRYIVFVFLLCIILLFLPFLTQTGTATLLSLSLLIPSVVLWTVICVLNQPVRVATAAAMIPDWLPTCKTLPVVLCLGYEPRSPQQNFLALHHLSHYATWLTSYSDVTTTVLTSDVLSLSCFESCSHGLATGHNKGTKKSKWQEWQMSRRDLMKCLQKGVEGKQLTNSPTYPLTKSTWSRGTRNDKTENYKRS